MRFVEVALTRAEFLLNGAKLATFFYKLQKSPSGRGLCSWMLSTIHFKRAAVYSSHRLLDTVQTSAWKMLAFG